MLAPRRGFVNNRCSSNPARRGGAAHVLLVVVASLAACFCGATLMRCQFLDTFASPRSLRWRSSLSKGTVGADDASFCGGRGTWEQRDLRSSVVGSAGIVQDSPSGAVSMGPALKVASAAIGLLKPFFALLSKIQALDYNQEEVREALKEEARSAPVVIYTYSWSPFSTEATKLLDSVGATYKEVVLAPEWFMLFGAGAAKRAELSAVFGRSSMPHIFIGGRSIGGYAEGTPGLLPLYESGGLEDALKAVGSIPEDNPFGFFTYSGDVPKERCIGEDFCEILET